VSAPPFTRSGRTWLSYGFMGAFGYVSYGLGAVIPDLRAELGVSAAAAGLHGSLFAAGLLAASAVTPRVAARLGRLAVSWAGALAMVAGTALVAAGPALLVTLAGGLVLGLGGGVVIITVGAALTSEHPRALLEGNVVASAAGVLSPLLVAAAIALGLGWEIGFGMAVAWIAVFAVLFGRARLGAAETGETPCGRESLPRAYWRRWAVIVGVVGAEFAFVFWAGSFLREEAGLAAAGAVAGAAVFNGAMLAGRIVGSRLALAVQAPERLLRGGLLLGLVGALVFVLAPVPALNLLGLVIAGLGAANTFPAAYAFALAAAPGRSDQASARVLLGCGLAILLAPLALGALGDVVGLAGAVAIIPCLLLATLVLTLAAEGRGLASKGHVGSHAH